VISFKNLRKSFGSLVVLDNLNLDIKRSEIFGLLGPNGAGKTTAINLAVGLLEPDQGRVELKGLGAPSSPDVRKRIGVAPQALAFYEELSAEENICFFAKIQGLHGSQLKERASWSLHFVGLSDRKRDRVKTFSGGMKRRLNFAIALVHDPPLLLLDEPTVGVDPQSRNAIFDNIEELRKEGRTIIYTTHYMEEAQRLCDRVGIIDYGKLLALDTVDSLIAAFGGKSTVIAELSAGEVRIETEDPMAELLRLKKGTKLRRFRVESPDLEGVFLNLTGRSLRD